MLRKDVYERYLEVFKSRKFDNHLLRYGNGTSTSGVYYTLLMAAWSHFVMLNKVKHLAGCKVVRIQNDSTICETLRYAQFVKYSKKRSL